PRRRGSAPSPCHRRGRRADFLLGAGSLREGHFGRADLRVCAEIRRLRRAAGRAAGARYPPGVGGDQRTGGRVVLSLAQARAIIAIGDLTMKIKIVVHEAEEGGYWAEVPAIPGCATQGETMEELMQNLREAIEGCLSIEVAPPEPGGVERMLELPA